MRITLVLSLILGLVVGTVASQGTKQSPIGNISSLVLVVVALLTSLFPEEFGYSNDEENNDSRPSTFPIEREKRHVSDIF